MRSALVRGFVNVALKPVMGPPVPLAVQRRWLQALATGAGPAGEAIRVGGRPAERHGSGGPGSVLMLHGGAFVTSSPRTHRVLAAQLAAAAGVPVVVPDYRLAPEHPHPAAVDDVVAAYDELAERGPVAVVGDSAGGTLALLLARVRQPVALGLVSPVTDLTGATSRGYDGRDALLRQDWLESGAQAFVGAQDAAALSPLSGDLSGLPPTLVHVCERERLLPDAQALVARAREAGAEVELRVLPGLWHDVHVFAHLVPEAASANADLGRWIGAHL